jgi:plastocyanin
VLKHLANRAPGLREFLVLGLCLPFSAAFVFGTQAQSTTSSVQTSTAADPDAAARAAARKKRFLEQEKALEENGSTHDAAEPDPQQTLFVSPALVGMVVGETQRFTVFDIEGHNLTSQAEWSLSNSYIADLAPDGTPTITAKEHGTVTVRARVGSRESRCEVKVYEGSSLPIGAIRWQAPKIPNFSAIKIVQAVPTTISPATSTKSETPVKP